VGTARSARPTAKDKKKFTVLAQNDDDLDDMEMAPINASSGGASGWGLDMEAVASSSTSTSRSADHAIEVVDNRPSVRGMGGILSALRGKEEAGEALILVPPVSLSGEVFDAQW
jgi:hypothetical protein